MKIQKLPSEAQSKLESGIVITDSVQCVLELVHNSLDAEATAIAVRIDLKNYQIQVIDNGKGIDKEDLELVGQRFMTSKHNSPDTHTSVSTYGYKGQAIASLVDVCKSLTIETKSSDNDPALIKVFRNKKAFLITESNAEKIGTGTTVTIEDFMYTMPVRQLRMSEVFDVEEIKTQLQYLAVIHYNVCFTLRNGSKGLISFQKQPTSNILLSISSIFGKSTTKSLKPLNHQEEKYEISGYVSLKPQKQKLQLLYVNKRIITRGLIHKFLNNLLKEYSERILFKESSLEQGNLLKKLKTTLYNMFILEIKCPCSCYEIFTNLRKTKVEFKNWKKVLKCLYKAIKKAFKFNGRSLDSSGNTEDPQENKKVEKKVTHAKTMFGTSVLINAVRGAPVRRDFIKRGSVTKKRKKNENITKPDVSLSRIEQEVKDCILKGINPGPRHSKKNLSVCLNDSLESPIPKAQFKPLHQLKPSIEVEKLTPKGPNESYIQFYDWVKGKSETDARAYNLYNNFLQHKQSNEELKSGNAFSKSPVLGRKSKGRKVFVTPRTKLKNFGKINSPNNRPEADDERLINKRKRYEELSPGFQFHTETRKETPDNFPPSDRLNLKFNNFERWERRNGQKMLKNSSNLPIVSKAQREMEIHYPRPSPAASEIFFTNTINFRNLSASFGCLPSNTQRAPVNYYHSTWTSHYQDSTPGIFQKRAKQEKVLLDCYEAFEHRRLREKNREPCRSKRKAGLCDLNSKRTAAIRFHDAEIQADMSQIIYPRQKVNATVQTDNSKAVHVGESEIFRMICESPCFENDEHFPRQNIRDFELSYRDVPTTENNLNQEVPEPDFWNIPTPENNKGILPFPDPKTGRGEHVEKASSSSELCCGQKSGAETKPQSGNSGSKETQTLAAMWSDCLEDIGNPSGGLIESKLNSEGSQLPKTIPVEELEDVPEPTESNFCLTERHYFVPKGLSPKYLAIEEEPKTFFLSPRERQKINSVIDDSENELLASVKWQDESTGGSTKPTIPDGILDEMRGKAERNLIYRGNEILSASLSYCAIKVHNLLHSFSFTKGLLSGVEVLGQLDKKFIVARMKLSAPHRMELISLFDQHAVDERIKLEELMHDYTTPEGRLILNCLNPSIECVLGESTVQLISNLQENLLASGLDFEIVDEETISFNNVPAFLWDKSEKNPKNKKGTDLVDALQAWIMNVAEETTETRGAPPKIPKIVHDALCSEACHKAIKFNKELTKEAMVDMINKLKNCKLPFQCAHGRPSVIPIIDLQDFNESINEDNVDMSAIKKFARSRQDDAIGDSEGVGDGECLRSGKFVDGNLGVSG